MNAPATTPVAESSGLYVRVWLVLLALLGLTCAGAWIPGRAGATTLHLAVSFTQAALVLLFPMHLRRAHPALRLFAVIGVVGIAILVALSLADVLTR